MTEDRNPAVESIHPLREIADKAIPLTGSPTGVSGLDDLFYRVEVQDGRFRQRPLGGYPAQSVIHITGISDTGKSLMGEQFALQQASLGNTTVLVTVETPAPFLISGLKQRAQAMGINFADVEEHIVIIDAAVHSNVRENLPVLLDTLAHAYRTYNARNTVIDSITGLYEAREMVARQIVRPLYSFLKKWHQTALLISQKRSGHEELTAEAAGGFTISHIVDATLVVAKHLITSPFDAKIYKRPIGEVVRLFRIDGCRMCGHDTDTHLLEITPEGLVKIGPPLKALTT